MGRHPWVALVFAAALAGCGGALASREASPTADRSPAPRQFVPPTYRDGENVVLPLTFSDGTAVEVLYPPALHVAELGVRPYGSGYLHGKSPDAARSDIVGRDFHILPGTLERVLGAFPRRSEPRALARYPGRDGTTVGFWDVGADVHYLAFQFGRWSVLVYDYRAGAAAMTDAERRLWSASFAGRESPAGFLLLDALPPLRLARAGEHAGPELLFGPPDRPPRLALYPGPCRAHRGQKRRVAGKLVDWSPGFADWCLSEAMRVHASGGPRFVAAMIRGLAVRDGD